VRRTASDPGRFHVRDFQNLCLGIGINLSIGAAQIQNVVPAVHFICVGASVLENIPVADCDFLDVPICPEDQEILGDDFLSFTDPETVEALKRRLGSKFLSVENGRLTVHQALLVVSI
jgi:hypothetical protein